MSKKNKISEQEVKKIAELSRLSLTNEELKKRTEDMNNILDCAKNKKLELPLSKIVKKMYNKLVKKGLGNYDHSSLYKSYK